MLTFAEGKLLREMGNGSTRMGREADRSICAVAIGLLTRKAWYRRIDPLYMYLNTPAHTTVMPFICFTRLLLSNEKRIDICPLRFAGHGSYSK